MPWPEIDADKALPWIESRTGLSLADSQAEAIRLAIRSKVLVITGGPGVGKTTIVNFNPAHPASKVGRAFALCSDRPRRQAHDRSDRNGGENDPPPS
ncbi:MAG: AAA family ATPase [Limimaricola soesokkakensis]|uniref:AAA family ATPase n=1 Tax=Limimaricola soesokkakensis TaxID=1343159 RepID=UPI0040593651